MHVRDLHKTIQCTVSVVTCQSIEYWGVRSRCTIKLLSLTLQANFVLLYVMYGFTFDTQTHRRRVLFNPGGGGGGGGWVHIQIPVS